MDIRDDVKQFIIENYLFGQAGDLKDDDSFVEMGIIDSTGVIELVAFLEDRFSITIDSRSLVSDNLDSIDSVTRFVASQLAQSTGIT
jgi:acyl carrier protein